MKVLKKVILSLGLVLSTGLLFAASDNSNYVHNWVTRNGVCKNGAISDNHGYVITYGVNGATWSGIPNDLADAIREESNAGRRIDDIIITENGGWYLVGGKLRGKGFPTEFGNKISEAVRIGDVVLSVCFNDEGDWVIVANNHIYASDDNILQWIKQYQNQYGYVESVYISNNGGMIAIYDYGWAAKGPVPQGLTDYLNNNWNFDPVYAKFTDNGSWIVTDNSGYNYGYDLK